MTRSVPFLLAVLAAATACESTPPGDAGSQADSVAQIAETRALTEGLALWRADGFTMLVPETADVIPRRAQDDERWAAIIAGPGFVRETEDGGTEPGPPAYRIDVATYDKPDTLELETWVSARPAPASAPEGMTNPGEERPDPPAVTVAVAGEPALRVGAASREPGPVSYWLERGETVVEFRLSEEPESPLAGIQRHVQSLILSTFRWSPEAGAGEE